MSARALRFAIAAMIILPITSTHAAPSGRETGGRDRAARGGSGNEASSLKPLPSDPVKRTWDFTKSFGIPSYRAPFGDCTQAIADFQQSLANYNARVDEFLSGPTDAKKLGLERKNSLRTVTGLDRDIATYSGGYAETGKRAPDAFVPPLADDMCRAKAQLQNLIGIREGLAAIGRVYPDMAEVGPMLAKVNAAIATIGDEKTIAAMVQKNRSASLASVRMKPALSTNPTWQKWFRDYFTQAHGDQSIIKLNLYSADWYVKKNELTSYPEYRQIGAWIAAKGSDGVCKIYSIDLFQNYIGGSFDSGRFTAVDAPQQILCENI